MHKINGDLITLVHCRMAVERNVSYSKVLCTKQNVTFKSCSSKYCEQNGLDSGCLNSCVALLVGALTK